VVDRLKAIEEKKKADAVDPAKVTEQQKKEAELGVKAKDGAPK